MPTLLRRLHPLWLVLSFLTILVVALAVILPLPLELRTLAALTPVVGIPTLIALVRTGNQGGADGS